MVVRNEMKVGDLVRVPATVIGNHAKAACVGIVLDKAGYKIMVGTPRGNEVWDEYDIRILRA
jgi:hypothetical protein